MKGIENLSIEELFDRAIDNHKKNNLKVAKKLYETILEIDSNYSLAHNNLGLIFKELGQHQKAISCHEKSIQLEPDYAGSHFDLGIVFQELGEDLKALSCYEKAIQLEPTNINIINGLSELFRVIQLYNVTKTNSARLKKLFLLLFKRNDIDHQGVFYNAKKVLFVGKKDLIQNLAKEELLLLMLQKSLIADEVLEKLLTKLRGQILFSDFVHADVFDFIVSLAQQCFLNEYVYIQSEKEINEVTKLKNRIENSKKINELEIAILGCYTPLYTLKNIRPKLLKYISKNILFNDLITVQLREPLQEVKLVNSIKSFGKITNDISKKVRKQYEEHPYPRWRHTYNFFATSTNFLSQLNNDITPNKVKYSNKFDNPNILIAGCGTGKDTTVAEIYINANILAVDLSLPSLAYAKRKTEESALQRHDSTCTLNVEFLHADILQLKNLNRKFDVIESIGVLHHMKDPIKGLKVLVDILEPHGFMKLGLYSESGWQRVVKARELINKKKFKNTIEDIRNCREIIFNEKNDPLLQKITTTPDFYSTSMVRDLLFHVQTHLFTIPEISKILKDLNLEFLGFVHPLLKSKFSLNQWNKFEINNPDTFFNMYQFWVRKIH